MERDYKVGDIVAIRPEWHDVSESSKDLYLIREVLGQDMVIVDYIDVDHKFTFGSTHCYSTDWIYYVGTNVKDLLK